MYHQIAIDGPSGAGKSSLAQALAKELDYLYINTGLIFRGLAWYLLKYPDLDIREALTNIAQFKNFVFSKNRWFLNDKEISKDLLVTQEVTNKSSLISQDPTLRNYVLLIERSEALENNVIMEGRDIGTTIFPKAVLKIFLNADPKIRAKRRYEELKKSGLLKNRRLEDIEREIIERDVQDSERKFSPLRKADDAIEIISDNKSIEETVREIKKLLKERLLLSVTGVAH